MLFTQFNMEDALEANYEEGFEDGLLAGTQRGELQKTIRQVSTKLLKGKSPEMIADELEEDVETIKAICALIQEYGTDMDIKEIYEKLNA